MAPRNWSVCGHCGTRFKVCRYNAHHQKYCQRAKCVLERKRLRQRQSYRKRYQSDDEFREAERKRAREGIHARRQETEEPESVLDGVDPLHVIAAVVSQLTDEVDPESVAEKLHAFAGRGRLLTLNRGDRGVPP